VSPFMPCRHTAEVQVQLHSFSASIVGGDEWSNSSPASFCSGKKYQYLWRSGGPLTGLNGFEEGNFVCPAGIRISRLFNS
jgi:hypothetical protein